MKLAVFQKKFKAIGLIISLLVLLALAVLAGKKASFFLTARASSCQAKQISVKQVTGNSVIISWTTENESQGRLIYGPDKTNLAFSVPEPSAVKLHNIPLTVLT